MEAILQSVTGLIGNQWAVGIVGLLTLAFLIAHHRRRNCKTVLLCENIIRPLGMMESVFYNAGQHGSMLLVNIIFLRSNTGLHEENIAEALKRLMKLHPLLNVGVKRHQGKFVYVRQDVETAIPIGSDKRTSWQEAFEDQSHLRFEGNNLLWKVVFLPNARLDELQTHNSTSHHSAVIFVFNHAIIDGASYMRLFNTFQDILADVLDDRPTTIAPFPLLPSQEDFIKPYLSCTVWQRFFTPLLMRCMFSIPPLTSFLLSKLAPVNSVYLEEFSTEVQNLNCMQPKNCTIPIILNKETTKAILAMCKEKKTTVQGAIQAASMMAAAHLWKKHSSQTERLKVNTEVTLNLRGAFEEKVPAEALGVFIGRLESTDYVPTSIKHCEEFWQLAKQISSSLHAKLKEKTYLDESKGFDSMESVSPTGDVLVQFILRHSVSAARGRTPALLTYSNMGNCSFLNRPAEGPVEIVGRFGMSTQHLIGAVFYNNLATFNDRLFWNIVYCSHVVPKRLAHDFVGNIYDILNIALNNN